MSCLDYQEALALHCRQKKKKQDEREDAVSTMGQSELLVGKWGGMDSRLELGSDEGKGEANDEEGGEADGDGDLAGGAGGEGDCFCVWEDGQMETVWRLACCSALDKMEMLQRLGMNGHLRDCRG